MITLIRCALVTLVGCTPAVVLPPVPASPDDSSQTAETETQRPLPAPTELETVVIGPHRIHSTVQKQRPTIQKQQLTIQKQQLEQILDHGPGAFLAGVSVKAQFRNGRFFGWRVMALPGTNYDRVGILIGDIVQRVNQYTLRTPSDFERLWKSLRTATNMVVVIHRAGQRAELHYEIQD